MCDGCQREIEKLKAQQRDLWADLFEAATALKGTDRDIAAHGRAIALLHVQIGAFERAERRHLREPVRDVEAEPVEIPRERPRMEPHTDLGRGLS